MKRAWYWAVDGTVSAGAHPARDASSIIRQTGATLFVDLTEPRERLHDYAPTLPRGVDALRIPIRDLGVPNDQQIAEALTAIRSTDVAYVHCRMGIGRTGTIIACYLIDEGMSMTDALASIASSRRRVSTARYPSPEMPEQMDLVQRFARQRGRA